MPKTTLITSTSDRGRHIVYNLVAAGFDSAGLRPDEAQYLVRRGNLVKKRARELFEELAVGCPASCETAQDILGEHFFGVADWKECFGITFTKSQLAKVSTFPWNEKILTAPCPFHPGRQVKDTHFAFLGLERLDKKRPLTIQQWQELCPASSQPRFYSYPPESWYNNDPFATTVTCQLRWYLLLKDIVPDSESKTFAEQQHLLPNEYAVPSAVTEVAKDLLCFKKTGHYVNGSRHARTADLTSDGYRVNVGYFASRGLDVFSWWGDERLAVVGLGAARNDP